MSLVNGFARTALKSLCLATLATAAFAAQPIVKTVPWVAADPSVPHETFAFKNVTLKGTSSLQGPNIRATWDFGDGSQSVSSTVTNGYDVSATHAYSGVSGTVYNARLTVSDQSTGEYSFADYPIAVRDQTLDVQVNVAIDEGLWYLHRSMNRTATTGDWQGTACYACDVTGEATAWNLLAFERQGHLDTGDSANPYTETVARAHASVAVQVAALQLKGKVWARAAGVSSAADLQTSSLASDAGIAPVDPGTLVARQNTQGYWLGNNPASTAGFETAQALFALSATPIHFAGVNSVTNVSAQVTVTNTGFTFNRATQSYSGNLTVTNISGSTIAGPITVGITNLPATVVLSNSNGTFNTAPYRSITPNPLLAGASVSVPVIFSNPNNVAITFNRFTYSGNFPPAALTLACPANTGKVGVAYNSTPDANGGVLAYTFSISVGSLPAGLNINAGTGAITGTPTTAGNVNFTVLVTDAAGQNGQTASQPCSINVAPDTTPQTISFTSSAPGGAVVGGPTYTPTATATSGLTVALTIDAASSGVCSISGGIVSFQAPGTCIVDANQAGDATYAPAPQVQQSFTVGKGNQTISFTSSAPGGATVGGTPYNVTATATSGLTVAFTIDASATSVCSIAGSTVSFLTVGTCVINANQPGNANYNSAPQVQQSFAVGKGNQTISFTSTPPPSPTVGGPTYNVTATATSGLTVTFAIDASATSVCSIAGSTVSFLAAGNCIINANQAGNANYNAAPQVQQTVGVGKSAQTISFTSSAPGGAVVAGPTYNVTATATSGLTVAFTIDASATSVCSIAGSTVSFLAAGTCVINANQAGNASYNAAPQVQQSFAVGQGSQTISFTSSAPGGAIVGGPTYNVTATATSGLTVVFTSNTPAVCGVSGSTVSFLTAGSCVINANQPGNANYTAAPQVQQSFTVGKGNQTISFTSVAPVGATVAGPTYNVTATATSGLTVAFTSNTPTICTIAGSTVSFIAAGTCTINANQAGDANYNAAPQAQQSFTVAKGNQTITFTSTAPSNALVGGATYAVTATATSGLTVTFTIDASASSVCSIAGSTVSFLAGGTCVINANQAGNANYNAAPQVQQSFQVSQPPTITSLDHVTFKPGLPGQSFTVTTTGFPTGASMVITQTGALPSGVNFTNNNNGTATINGTPASGTAGSSGTPPSQIYALVITANNGIAPNATQNPFNLTIACPVITVSAGPTSPWQLVFNTLSTAAAFSQSGGSSTIAWSASNLPTGLAMNSGSGVISGTPSVTGVFSVVVTATDAGGCIGTKALTINVGPNLAAQAFTGVGNTQFYVSGVSGAPSTPAVVSGTGLLVGATPGGQVLVTGATCTGGTITTDGAGLFIFTPNVSVASPVNCTYTASSNTGGGASSGPASTTANLTFTLNNKVWYVTHGASGGDGRSNLPFGDFGGAANQLNCTATTATGDFIYVAQGSGNTTGACALKTNQTLIGAGATLNVPTVSPILTVAGNAANTPTITGTLSAASANGLTVNGVSMNTGASTAVNVQGSTGSNFTFRSISSSGTGNGIILTGTTGSFTVTGDGSDTSLGGNSSGGTIANMSGADNGSQTTPFTGVGIYMNNVQNVTLRRMTVNGTNQNYGIRGFAVNGFTLEYSTVSGANGTTSATLGGDNEGEGSIVFGNISNNGLAGSGTFTKNVIQGGRANNLFIYNTAAGTATVTIKGNTFGLTQSFSDAAASLQLKTRNNGTILNSVVGGTVAGEPNTFTGSAGDNANFTGQQQSTQDVVFRNNVLSNSHPNNNVGGGSMTLATAGTMTFHVTGNTMRDANGSAVTLFKASATLGTPSLTGFFDSNTIGVAAVANSGSVSGNGIFVSAAGTGTMSYTITNNQIHQIKGNSHIYADNTGGSYTGNFTITGNTFDTPVTGWFAGVAITNGSPSSADTINVCADIGGAGALKNTFSSATNLGNAIFIYPAGAAAGHVFNLPGANVSSQAAIQTFLDGRNTITGLSGSVADIQPNATLANYTNTGTSCSTPSN